MVYRVPLAFNSLGEEEYAALVAVMATGQLTQGALVEQFEREFAAFNGAKHAILVNSGSSANLIAIEAIIYASKRHLGLMDHSLGQGDEVVVPGLSWPTTLKPLINLGVTPVFCDIDLASLNATVETVAAARTKATRGVIAVPVLGNPHGLDELRDYCTREGLVLIEDACESLGARSPAGVQVGNFGLASAFSFYFSHHMTTVEGGAILTNSDAIADLCYALRSHGWTRHLKLGSLNFDQAYSGIDSRFCFFLPGYNVRATELTAALGRVQLRRLPKMLERRRQIASNRVAALNAAHAPVVVPGGDNTLGHSWMTFPMLFRSNAEKAQCQAYLEEQGIETRPIIVGNVLRHPIARWLPLHDPQPELPACDEVFERGLMIGLNPMSRDEDYIHSVFRGFASRIL